MLTHVRSYPCPQPSLFTFTQCSHMSERIHVPRCPCFQLLNAHPCQSVPMSLDVLVSYYSMITHVRVYPCPQTYLFYITQCLLMSERIHVPRCPCFLLLNAHTCQRPDSERIHVPRCSCFLLLNAHPCQSIPMSLDVLVFYYPMLTHLFFRIWCCH